MTKGGEKTLEAVKVMLREERLADKES